MNDPVNLLPTEILEEMIVDLKLSDLELYCNSPGRMAKMCQNQYLWRIKLENDFPDYEIPRDLSDYKSEYYRLYKNMYAPLFLDDPILDNPTLDNPMSNDEYRLMNVNTLPFPATTKPHFNLFEDALVSKDGNRYRLVEYNRVGQARETSYIDNITETLNGLYNQGYKIINEDSLQNNSDFPRLENLGIITMN